MEFCLVYVPSRAELYRLNPSAWFVFSACDGRRETEIAKMYRDAMEGEVTMEKSLQETRAAIRRLVEMEIIEEAQSSKRARHSTNRRACDAEET